MRRPSRLALATALVLGEAILAIPAAVMAVDSLTVVRVWPPPGRRPGFMTPPETIDSGDWVEVTLDYVVESVPQATVRMDGTVTDTRPTLTRGSGRTMIRAALRCVTELTSLRLYLHGDGRDLVTVDHPVGYRADCRPDLAITGLTVAGLPATTGSAGGRPLPAGAVLDLRATSAVARGLRGCTFDVAVDVRNWGQAAAPAFATLFTVDSGARPGASVESTGLARDATQTLRARLTLPRGRHGLMAQLNWPRRFEENRSILDNELGFTATVDDACGGGAPSTAPGTLPPVSSPPPAEVPRRPPPVPR